MSSEHQAALDELQAAADAADIDLESLRLAIAHYVARLGELQNAESANDGDAPTMDPGVAGETDPQSAP